MTDYQEQMNYDPQMLDEFHEHLERRKKAEYFDAILEQQKEADAVNQIAAEASQEAMKELGIDAKQWAEIARNNQGIAKKELKKAVKKYYAKTVDKVRARDSQGRFVSQKQPQTAQARPQRQQPADVERTLAEKRQKVESGQNLSEQELLDVLGAVVGPTL